MSQKDEKQKNSKEEEVAPGFKVSSRVGSGLSGDREATKEEKEKGDYTHVVNLSND